MWSLLWDRVYFSKRSQWAANGAQGGSSGGGTGLGKREALEDRTFAVYKNFSAIAIGTHQYSSIVYLFVCQARLAVDDFEKLGRRATNQSRLRRLKGWDAQYW